MLGAPYATVRLTKLSPHAAGTSAGAPAGDGGALSKQYAREVERVAAAAQRSATAAQRSETAASVVERAAKRARKAAKQAARPPEEGAAGGGGEADGRDAYGAVII